MQTHLVALSTALAALAPAATAATPQCDTSLTPVVQSIGPLFEPSVSELLVWDPDGAGPATEVVVFAGDFFDVDGQSISDIAAYDPATDTFSQFLPPPINYPILDLALSPDGRAAVILQVDFESYAIHEWDGLVWTNIASVTGSLFSADGIYDVIYLANGDLIAGGEFAALGGAVVDDVARWDGAAWSQYGTGLPSSVLKLQLNDQGELIAGLFGFGAGPGDQAIARYDGSVWQPYLYGTSGIAERVDDLFFLADGRVAGAGRFDFAPLGGESSIAVWNGFDWTLPGPGIPPEFNGYPTVFGLQELPGGDLLVGGTFAIAGGVASSGLARWDGAAWTDADDGSYLEVQDLLLGPDDDVWVAGRIHTTPGSIAGGLGRFTSSCKPTSTAYGAGGSGSSGGPITLTTTGLPWIGDVASAEVEGLAPGALAVTLISLLATDTPLSSFTPHASVDSTLLVLPITSLVFPLPASSPTSASWDAPLPATPSLVGASLFLQAMSVEVLPGGGLLLATSNGVEWVPGQF